MDRKSKQIEIFGEKCFLFERSAEDVMAMISFAQQQTDITSDIAIYQAAKILESSLKLNVDELKWYQFIKKLKYIIKFRFKNIIKKLSHTQIFKYSSIVFELDGFVDSKSKSDKKKISK